MHNNYLLLDDTSCFAITCNFWYTLIFSIWFKCSATFNACNDARNDRPENDFLRIQDIVIE